MYKFEFYFINKIIYLFVNLIAIKLINQFNLF